MTLSNLFGVVLAAVGRSPREVNPAPDDDAPRDERGRASSAVGYRARENQGMREPRALFDLQSPRRAAAG